MTARVGVITFPGSLDDRDAARAVRLSGAEPVSLWHTEVELDGVDAVVLPGGFSYGDYLRAGAIARFAPLMEKLITAAHDGLPVLGICNGFQMLCEAYLLPGALTRNTSLHFVCRAQRVRIENAGTPWTSAYEQSQEIVVPIKNIDGCYIADEATLEKLETGNRVVARYVDVNPNGSLNDIAGICNEAGNVVGLMPHPEHAVESLTGPSTEGLGFFTSILQGLASA